MAKELLSPETGLRLDGRRPHELRKIRCKMGIFSRADGSAYFEQGNTKAIAAVYGPREASIKSRAQHDRAIIHCEYSMATFSTGERKKRTKGDRRAIEISLLIRQIFETAIITTLFPKSQIDIYVQILQADGGTRCAAINAACLAVIDAGIPMKDFVCSCAAGAIGSTPILDLNYQEDSGGNADLPVAVLPSLNKITMVQMDSRLPIETFEKVLELAVAGAKQVHTIMKAEVKDHVSKLAERRGV